MEHIEEKKIQIKKNYQKIFLAKRIQKTSLLTLKKQIQSLSKMDPTYKSFFSRFTTQVNGMKTAILNEDRKEKIKNLIEEFL